jgi:hypothetical protein
LSLKPDEIPVASFVRHAAPPEPVPHPHPMPDPDPAPEPEPFRGFHGGMN